MLTEYLEMYLDDTNENILEISENILKLEKDTTNKEYIDIIFRAAHTIKGASASMDLKDITNVTHHLEDLFDDVRSDKIVVDKEFIKVVLQVLDCIEQLKNQITDSDIVVDSEAVVQMISSLRAHTGSSTSSKGNVIENENEAPELDNQDTDSDMQIPLARRNIAITDAIKSVIYESYNDGFNVFYIRVLLEDDCVLKSARIFMVHEKLISMGEILAITPSVTEIEQPDFCDTSVEIVYICRDGKEAINKALNMILEVKEITIDEMSIQSLSEQVTSKVSTALKDGDASDNIVKDDASEESDMEISKSEQEIKKNSKSAAQTMQSFIRVSTKTLDNLMNQEGELLVENNRLKILLDKVRRGTVDMDNVVKNLEDIGDNISKILSNQQEIIMSTRMFPLSQLFNRFPRLVREIADKCDKEVEIELEGQDTELDRTILEKVTDPMIHILRNAVDHGIETPGEREACGKSKRGKVKITAKQENGMVFIYVEDDGKGIDIAAVKKKAVEKGVVTPEAAEKMSDDDTVNLIFLSGFSTAKSVTDVSGRGVGMDIVKSKVEEIGGAVSIKTVQGKGSTFIVKIPLTLAISKALLTGVGGEIYIILLNNIKEIVEINRTDIEHIQGQETFMLRNTVYPLIYLRNIYGYEEMKKDKEKVVLVGNNERITGLVVDEFLGEQEIVVKALSKYLYNPKYVSGVTKLGDGSIPILVDIISIIEKANKK